MGTISILIIILTAFVSYNGLKSRRFLRRYEFQVDKVLLRKDYKRLVTSGFVHLSWTHLIFNMLTLFLFSATIESTLGIPRFLIIYFGSLLGGNLFALFIHRNHGEYSAVGASGAING